MLNVLGLYLKASIPLPNAINLTKRQLENTKLVKFLDFLHTQIKEGQSLYSAIESQKIIKLPKYIVNSIKIGEESGKLDVVLLEMAKFLKEEEKIASKTLQALIYPAFIIIVSIFMIAFMLTTVVPKIVKIFENLHQQLPPITKFVIESGNFLQKNFVPIILFTLLIVTLYSFLYQKSKKFKLLVDSIILKLPIVRKIVISKELGRFSYLTYVLTNSGINYVTAINLAANTIENDRIKSVFRHAIQEVVEGKRFSHALHKVGFRFDKSFVQAIALAEETGETGNILGNISQIYFEENESRINTLLSLLEPLMIILVGGAIGFIVTALLLPMFSMNILQ